MKVKIHTSSSFCHQIERLVCEQNIGYLEAICDYMTANNIEPEVVPKLINHSITEKIRAEAVELNLMDRGKKSARLF